MLAFPEKRPGSENIDKLALTPAQRAAEKADYFLGMKNQITPFTCGLACLEGVLADLGLADTQETMLVTYKSTLLYGITGHDFGTLNRVNVRLLAAKLGVKVQIWKDHDPASVAARFAAPTNVKGAIIGFTREGVNHMAKVESCENHVVTVSEPDFNKDTPDVKSYTVAELIGYDFEDWHFTK